MQKLWANFESEKYRKRVNIGLLTACGGTNSKPATNAGQRRERKAISHAADPFRSLRCPHAELGEGTQFAGISVNQNRVYRSEFPNRSRDHRENRSEISPPAQTGVQAEGDDSPRVFN